MRSTVCGFIIRTPKGPTTHETGPPQETDMARRHTSADAAAFTYLSPNRSGVNQ